MLNGGTPCVWYPEAGSPPFWLLSSLQRRRARAHSCSWWSRSRQNANWLPIMVVAAAEGACTFCGARVALSASQHSEARPPAAERAVPAAQLAGGGAGDAPEPGAAAGPSRGGDASVEEAVAFKNRLVRSPFATTTCMLPVCYLGEVPTASCSWLREPICLL